MSMTELLFSFRGRIGVRTFWLGTLIQLVILGLICIPVAVIDPLIFVPNKQQPAGYTPNLGAALLYLFGVLLSTVMGLAISTKRCHDRGKSGWFVLIILIPLVGALWLIYELGIGAGNAKANDYGPAPDAPIAKPPGYDVPKWKALVDVDPQIAAAVASLQPLGAPAVERLAKKYMMLNDKQYLNALVTQITDRYKGSPTAERLEQLGCGVDLIWNTNWGSIAQLKDGAALAISARGTEVFRSLAAFHSTKTADKYPGGSESWTQVQDPEGRLRFLKSAYIALLDIEESAHG